MGAQVGWSPEREARPRDGERCPTCGSEGLFVFVVPTIGAEGEWVFVPGRIAEGSKDVCARCMRWGRDEWLAIRMLREARTRGSIDPIPSPAGAADGARDRTRVRSFAERKHGSAR